MHKLIAYLVAPLALLGCGGFFQDPQTKQNIVATDISSSSSSSSYFLSSSSYVASGVVDSGWSSAASSRTISSSSLYLVPMQTPSSSSDYSFCQTHGCGILNNSLLWDLTVPNYEVQVPEVATGACGGPYTCAGWWMGYGQNGGLWMPSNADGSLLLADTTTGLPIEHGNLTATGLAVHLVAPAVDSLHTSIAGLYFNFSYLLKRTDVSNFGGFVITYTSSIPLDLELGWDSTAYGTDTWHAALPVHATSSALSLPWAVFKKDGWATGADAHALTVAEQNLLSLRIRFRNTTDSLKVGDFELQMLKSVSGGVFF